ncbi:MAG: four helix bundle protein [Bacteroidia bacterium]
MYVWQQIRELRKEISILAKKLPEAEKYNLTNQIIRSSISVKLILQKVLEDITFSKIFSFAGKQEVLLLKQ